MIGHDFAYPGSFVFCPEPRLDDPGELLPPRPYRPTSPTAFEDLRAALLRHHRLELLRVLRARRLAARKAARR